MAPRFSHQMNKFLLALEMLWWALQQMELSDWLLPWKVNFHLLSPKVTHDKVRCLLPTDRFPEILLTLLYFCCILLLQQFESCKILVFLHVLLQCLDFNDFPPVVLSGHLSLTPVGVWYDDQNSVSVFLG